ncbi:methionyl-tRNA formyltransferase [Oenococcus sicerae]|uniref:Methionyl-tRNA formyltransferase n=1 Tax=Oenococcus sicerae TaxID=2203724 RepID=A0AAJ1RAZ8_9LACO|nr:methionyl-tRNA formyltransferase [Oenococcus sicerae]MDN6899487.1 methionyl-tRNA formyltransferase [Oenococcus sicerae]VDK13764.1 Methionyl-tRNA formyltransferase {ECO:0000255/HAMAP-Rule:MF_00182} [Oenococcus sicerae]
MTNSVIFFGTSDFSASVLQGLIDDPAFQVLAVVSQPDRPVGRKRTLAVTQTKKIAIANNLAVFQPEKLSGSKEMADLIAMQADFLVTAAFGQFVPTKLLKSATVAAINVHASLLPKYRGAAPINWALINGDKKTGVSIMYMVREMDAGDIVSVREIPIATSDNAASLFEKLAIVGRDLLLETMPKMLTGDFLAAKQDTSRITLAPKIDNQLSKLDFYHKSAAQIVDLVRGLSPKPGASLRINQEQIKVFTAETGSLIGQTGQISILSKHDFAITAADGIAVLLQQVQPAGKKRMSVSAFLNGSNKSLRVGDRVDRV